MRSERDQMIVIDGSVGEGGGQILRSALALSLATGRPLRMERIRAGRARPGLLRQHLAAVRAAATIGSAMIEGAELGSSSLAFTPSAVHAGDYHFAIGSAGSTSLVLQTVLPPLMLAEGASTVVVEGGTHNPFAPTTHFLERAFLPWMARMGVPCSIALERYGFYPNGGGRVRLEIGAMKRLQPVSLTERGAVTRRFATAIHSRIPADVTGRELETLRIKLDLTRAETCERRAEPAIGAGNVVTVEVVCEHVTEVFTAFGKRGVRAEEVAGLAAEETQAYLTSNAVVWSHLADQLLLPMALAGGGRFTTGPLSSHATTNIDIIERFLPVRIMREAHGQETLIRVEPRS